MPYLPPPELACMSLLEIAEAVEARRLPPIDKWNPQEAIDSQMRIAADGTWFHEGRPITRKAMVRAFSSLLTRDGDGQHWLLTPQCRQAIAVEDAAFMAVDVQQREGKLAFRLNTDELVIAGQNHPLRALGNAETPAIYLAVRHGCEARLNRSTWLQLVDLAEEAGGQLAVRSGGESYPLVPG